MRSFSPLLVLVLSFVSFVISGPLHSTTHSSRLARNPISSRQFHYPRAPVDVCADVDLSLILKNVPGLNLGSLLGDICLCLSAFPLDLDLVTDLRLVNSIGETKLEALLEAFVEDNGTQCTYPNHASPRCTAGSVCDFTCTDGFIKQGSGCVCPLPSSVCNGKCCSYPNVCSSALPRAPKMTRRSLTSSRKTGGLLNLDANVGLNLGGSDPSSGSSGLNLGGLLSGLLSSLGTTSGGNQSSGSGTDIDIGVLVNGLLNSLDISVPISGGNQSSGLDAVLYVYIGTGIPGTQNLLNTITDLVNSLLSSLLGTTLNCKVDSSGSASVDPNTISIDLQVCGLSGNSLGSTLDRILEEVTRLLNDPLDDVEIVINSSVGGPGCPATPTLSASSQPLPSPSTPVGIPNPSVSPSSSSTPSGINLSLLPSTLGQVGGILGDLGLSLGGYDLDPGADLVVGVLVGLGNALSSVDGLVATVTALVDETLDCLLATNVTTVQANSNPTPSPTLSNLGPGDGIVVNIDLGVVLNATLSDTGNLVDGVLSAVSGLLANLLDLDVSVNVDGGPDCGCSGSRKASAKK